LRALADTIDSRGWAIKNVNVNLSAQPVPTDNSASSDRLVDTMFLPQVVSNVDVQASDDILDEQNSLVAQHFNQMLGASEQAHRQQIVRQLQQANNLNTAQRQSPLPASPNNYWFMNQPRTTNSTADYTTNGSVLQTAFMPNEQLLTQQLKSRRDESEDTYSHLRTIQPFAAQNPVSSAARQTAQNPSPTVTASPDPAILDLASNNDLNVATIARQAQKQTDETGDEVVISLH
jgi:hypothetical protein